MSLYSTKVYKTVCEGAYGSMITTVRETLEHHKRLFLLHLRS